jgi:hypothetical protein
MLWKIQPTAHIPQYMRLLLHCLREARLSCPLEGLILAFEDTQSMNCIHILFLTQRARSLVLWLSLSEDFKCCEGLRVSGTYDPLSAGFREEGEMQSAGAAINDMLARFWTEEGGHGGNTLGFWLTLMVAC